MISSGGHLLLPLLTIILVNLILSGDNAVVIALAVRSLAQSERTRALIAGAAGAVLLRVAVTFFAGLLLHVEFLKLACGVTILWIAVRLFDQSEPGEASEGRRPSGFWHAIWFIMAADVTMSLDNILAIAQVSQGSPALLFFGLGLSIPLVLFASGVLANLMDRYPLIVYLGAALLGKIGAEMILTDRFTVRFFAPARLLFYSLEAAAAAGVILAGRLLPVKAEVVSAAGRSQNSGP
jgi:YjbE family integral membrane protein